MVGDSSMIHAREHYQRDYERRLPGAQAYAAGTSANSAKPPHCAACAMNEQLSAVLNMLANWTSAATGSTDQAKQATSSRRACN